MDTLKVHKNVYEEMISWMKSNIPFEACGILVGKGNIVDEFIKMENVAKSETFFEMDLKELMKVLDYIDKENKDFIGVFHSHPVSNPYPSKTDLERNEIIDNLIFVISSLRKGTPEVKAYKISEKIVKEIEILII